MPLQLSVAVAVAAVQTAVLRSEPTAALASGGARAARGVPNRLQRAAGARGVPARVARLPRVSERAAGQ